MVMGCPARHKESQRSCVAPFYGASPGRGVEDVSLPSRALDDVRRTKTVLCRQRGWAKTQSQTMEREAVMERMTKPYLHFRRIILKEGCGIPADAGRDRPMPAIPGRSHDFNKKIRHDANMITKRSEPENPRIEKYVPYKSGCWEHAE